MLIRPRLAFTLIVVPLAANISSCQTNNLSKQGTFDPNDRSMTVPPGFEPASWTLKGGLDESWVEVGG
jgi:hypothetical protein